MDPQRIYVGSRHDELQPARLPRPGDVPDHRGRRRGRHAGPRPRHRHRHVARTRKIWEFTLKDGVKWEDGKAVTCEDFKYGVSRTFATDVITGGPNYILSYLDIPTDARRAAGLQRPVQGRRPGRSTRRSPATATRSPTTSRSRGRTSRWRSRRCSDRPVPRGQGPGRRSPTTQSSPTAPTSSRARGTPDKGGTFVRNTNTTRRRLDDVRKALPDKIVFDIRRRTRSIYDRLIADTGDDQYAVTAHAIPPAVLLADHRPGRGPLALSEVAVTSTTCCRTSTG